MQKNGLSSLGLLLALGLIISSYLGASAFKEVRLSDKSIKVKGFAEQHITSNSALWNGSLRATAKDSVSAYQALEASKKRFLTYLQGNGIPKDQITFNSVNIQSINKRVYTGDGESYETSEIDSYQLTLPFSFSSSDVAKTDRIARESTSLIAEGVFIDSYAPQYFYNELDSIKVNLLGEATKNAKARAEQLASNSGSKVGRLFSANQGVFQITPLLSTDVSDYGSYDTSTIEKSVKAVVTIEFGIE
jgi:hypothetical protein